MRRMWWNYEQHWKLNTEFIQVILNLNCSTNSHLFWWTSTKKFIRRFDKEFLFDRSTESSNTTIMNLFQQQDESSKAQEFQKESRSQESLKSKSSSSEMILQQQYEFKMMKLKVELMRLEAQKLTFAERNVSFQSTSNKSSASVYQWDKINIFYKYVAFRALKLAFKLEDQSNYNNWQNEVLTQTHFIEVKMILKNR